MEGKYLKYLRFCLEMTGLNTECCSRLTVNFCAVDSDCAVLCKSTWGLASFDNTYYSYFINYSYYTQVSKN